MFVMEFLTLQIFMARYEQLSKFESSIGMLPENMLREYIIWLADNEYHANMVSLNLWKRICQNEYQDDHNL